MSSARTRTRPIAAGVGALPGAIGALPGAAGSLPGAIKLPKREPSPSATPGPSFRRVPGDTALSMLQRNGKVRFTGGTVPFWTPDRHGSPQRASSGVRPGPVLVDPGPQRAHRGRPEADSMAQRNENGPDLAHRPRFAGGGTPILMSKEHMRPSDG